MTLSEKTQNKMLRMLILPFKWTELIEKEIVNEPDKFFAFIDQQTKERKEYE
jgi:hypothetical protein